MGARVAFGSLTETLLDAPTGGPPRRVIISGVHVAQATALVALIDESDGRLRVQNMRRLHALADVDGYLRLVKDGILPLLVDEPTATRALDLLEGYAGYIKGAAAIVGGSFTGYVEKVCAALMRYAKVYPRLQAGLVGSEFLRCPTEEMQRQVELLRSRHVTLPCDSDSDSNSDGDDSDSNDSASDDSDDEHFDDDNVRVASLAELVRLVTEVPIVDRAVELVSIHLCHTTAAIALLEFHSRGSVRLLNIRRLKDMAGLDTLLCLVKTVLRILVADPTSRQALFHLRRYAGCINHKAARVRGSFQQDVYAEKVDPTSEDAHQAIGHLNTFRSRLFVVARDE